MTPAGLIGMIGMIGLDEMMELIGMSAQPFGLLIGILDAPPEMSAGLAELMAGILTETQ